jgi:tetratricopeptide (TPR) repeat protein
MEVLDEKGDLIAWFSDDPDDWNSFSDYENRVRRMVLELNEELFSTGCHLLGYNGTNALDFIKLLGSINPNYTSDPNLQEKLCKIRRWANYRLTSCHPDNEDRLFQEVQIANKSYQMARSCWNSGRTEEAIKNFEKAGLYGHPSGYRMIGDIYMDGLGGIQRDIKKAIEYYEIGAEDEIGDCAFILGILYRDGTEGLSPDYELAYKWIRKAAILESCNAGNALGQLLENGWGCEKNLRKALYWYDVSLTGIHNGNRLRKILEGSELPLRLDGYDYGYIHYIEDVKWWRDHYIKNGMLLQK